jgi:hypothetical protein
MDALAIYAVTAALLKDRTDTQAPPPATPDQAPPETPGMIAPTVPEIRRLLAAAFQRPHPPGHATHWLNWRRRHHARSYSVHQCTRLIETMPWSTSKWRLPYQMTIPRGQ